MYLDSVSVVVSEGEWWVNDLSAMLMITWCSRCSWEIFPVRSPWLPDKFFQKWDLKNLQTLASARKLPANPSEVPQLWKLTEEPNKQTHKQQVCPTASPSAWSNLPVTATDLIIQPPGWSIEFFYHFCELEHRPHSPGSSHPGKFHKRSEGMFHVPVASLWSQGSAYPGPPALPAAHLAPFHRVPAPLSTRRGLHAAVPH